MYHLSHTLAVNFGLVESSLTRFFKASNVTPLVQYAARRPNTKKTRINAPDRRPLLPN
jgi:hypothetical protein